MSVCLYNQIRICIQMNGNKVNVCYACPNWCFTHIRPLVCTDERTDWSTVVENPSLTVSTWFMPQSLTFEKKHFRRSQSDPISMFHNNVYSCHIPKSHFVVHDVFFFVSYGYVSVYQVPMATATTK